MNILAKLLTAFRGSINEAGEAIVDSQALRILDQEIRDASEELNQSKEALASMIARQKLSEEKSAKLKDDIGRHEQYVTQALNKENDALALEIAQKIAELEQKLVLETESGQQFADSADKLRAAIKLSENNIKRIRQQVDTVKATESVLRAQTAVTERHSGYDSKIRTAMDSLERIKEKQALKAAQLNAANEMALQSEEATLQDKLEDAGIAPTGQNAEEILARIKNNRA